jgi:hypothetical protein
MIWFIQNIVFSISLIVIIHYLYLYFETTLTTPKVKDLIHCPKQKYNSLFDTINRKINHPTKHASASSSCYTTSPNDMVEDGNEDDLNRSSLGIVPKSTKSTVLDDTSDHHHHRDETSMNANNNTTMKNDLKSFLRTIGLKKQSTQPSRASYEPN